MPHKDDETRRAIALAYKNGWRRENQEAVNAYERAYYVKNHEALREKANKRYAEETPEKRAARIAYQREYVKNNPEAIREIKRRYREKNRDKLRESHREYVRGKGGNYQGVQKRKRAQKAIDMEAMAGRPRPEICDACGGPPDKARKLHFDHCHTHGHFRGWICRGCNLTLGYVQDDPARLLRLVAYLKRTSKRAVKQFSIPGV